MLDALLVENGAPTLACIKCANLMTAHFSDTVSLARQVAALRLRLRAYGVSLTILRMDAGSAQLYLYRPGLVERILSEPRNRAFLRREGYTSFRLDDALTRLRQRLRQDAFPHEIGLFLGYPLDDVLAFIRCEGKGCALCGVWKAYYHVNDARQYFEACRSCRLRAISGFRRGMTLEQLTVAG